MKLTRTRSALFVFALLPVFTTPAAQTQGQAGELADLDVAALVAEAHRNGARMAEHITEYTWTETAKLRQYDQINAGFQALGWPVYVIPDLAIQVVSGPGPNGSDWIPRRCRGCTS